ncbi:hypothetical protein Pmani_023527 [Petrolisthes manimaculis]|uniref:Uncharacterized protein n=1 Tax=Petrolisthes manimaculis TaxID=1843537 RepID=A0AAE1U399_9EUCA|nr:hypothetical protein Pmani_023527 [Petrolisthes manimaculis]
MVNTYGKYYVDEVSVGRHTPQGTSPYLTTTRDGQKKHREKRHREKKHREKKQAKETQGKRKRKRKYKGEEHRTGGDDWTRK